MKILIVAVHPDDESLMAGGSLLRAKARGDEIYWLICTSTKPNHSYFQTREEEIKQVAKAYDFNKVFNLRLDTMRVDEYSLSELVGKISNVINEVRPHTIILPFLNDVHSDHRKIFEAAYSCTKSFRYPFIKRVLMGETISESEFAVSLPHQSFVPNLFVDISEFLEKKCEILSIYKSELGDHPFPRSLQNVKALGCFRGASCGVKASEAFMILKQIE